MPENTDQAAAEAAHIDAPGYSGPDRRQAPSDWQASVERRFEDVNRRFAEGSETMRRLADRLDENTESTMRTETNTAELVTMFLAFKGAFKVFNMIGNLAKPLGYIVMCASAIWGAIVIVKTGGGHR